MSKRTEITGASQRVQKNGKGEWNACYMCHSCGDEFAYSDDFCKSEQVAREQSRVRFSIQERRFCWRCGYKITTLDPAPENQVIADLNARIDRLEAKLRERLERIKTLEDTLNGMTDAERIAIHRGWIRAVVPDEQDTQEV